MPQQLVVFQQINDATKITETLKDDAQAAITTGVTVDIYRPDGTVALTGQAGTYIGTPAGLWQYIIAASVLTTMGIWAADWIWTVGSTARKERSWFVIGIGPGQTSPTVTSTYSTDAQVQVRLQLQALTFQTKRFDGTLDGFRVAALREIRLEWYKRSGNKAPSSTDMAAFDADDPRRALIDVEADIGAALYRENLIELTEDARPERDKSMIWKTRAYRNMRSVIDAYNAAADFTKTRTDP